MVWDILTQLQFGRVGHHARAALFLAVVAVGLALVSCKSPLSVVCTDVGCDSGLFIELEGPTDESFTITAISGSSEPRVIECTAAEACWLFIPDYAPALVRIIYESADRTVEGEFDPDWELRYPNGRDCGPACVNATVILDLG